MIYRCIKDFKGIGGIILVKKGDAVCINDDYFHNVTSGLNLEGVSFEGLRPYLVSAEEQLELNKPLIKMRDILDKMYNTYKRKNSDYGNSFDKSLDEWGLQAAAIRIGDKVNRINSLIKNGSFAVKDESIRDTLLDLANYSVMTLMYLDKNV